MNSSAREWVKRCLIRWLFGINRCVERPFVKTSSVVASRNFEREDSLVELDFNFEWLWGHLKYPERLKSLDYQDGHRMACSQKRRLKSVLTHSQIIPKLKSICSKQSEKVFLCKAVCKTLSYLRSSKRFSTSKSQVVKFLQTATKLARFPHRRRKLDGLEQLLVQCWKHH